MAVLQDAVSAVKATIDANGNLSVAEGLPPQPTAGGYYTAAGGPAGIVAAALATDTSLVAFRFAAGSTRKAYLTKFRLSITPATLGASAGVSGSLGLQRITAAAPSGGTVRTANEQNEPLNTATDMTTIQDLASALTVTSVVFGNEIARCRVPLFVASGGAFEWIYEPSYPTVLQPGDGFVLRSRVAMAATQTWVFDYTAHWYEK